MIVSPSHVRLALDRRAEIDTELAAAHEALKMTKLGQTIERLQTESANLLVGVQAFAMRRYEPGAGNGYEDDRWLVTKVAGKDKIWHLDKLKTLLGARRYNQVTTVVLDRNKLDELVRSGAVSMDDIEDAFDEKPKAPYVKVTPRSESQDGEDEAAGLRAALEAHSG